MVETDPAGEEVPPGAIRLLFSVCDTGIGIAPEQLERIFGSFVQADSGLTKKYAGSGLGLAICRRLTRLMIRFLAKLDRFEAGPEVVAPKASASTAAGTCALFVPLAGAVDFDVEFLRLSKEEVKTVKDLTVVEKKLGNEDFVSRAPAEVVAKEREKQDALAERLAKLRELKGRIKTLMGE